MNYGFGAHSGPRSEATSVDPNLWLDNVEGEIAKTVGAETVTYVGNIYKYHVAYTLLLERKAAEEEAPQEV